MAYNGTVDLIAGLRQKNNGTFPLVDAPAVRITDDLRLNTALNNIENSMAAEFDSSSAYAVGNYCIHDAKLYVAKTATAANDGWIAARWQQVTVMGTINDQVRELKTQLNDLEDFCYTQKELSTNKDYTVPANNVLNTSADPLTVSIPTGSMFTVLLDGNAAETGIQYNVSVRDSSNTEIEYFNCFTGQISSRLASGNIKYITLYSNKTGIVAGDEYTLTVEWMIEVGGENSVEYRLNKAEDDVSTIKNELNTFENDYYEEESSTKTIQISAERNVGYTDKNGTNTENESYVHTQKIAVTPGDILTLTGTYGADTAFSATISLLCAYNSTNAVPAKGLDLNYTEKSYTVPDGIDGVVISYLASVTAVIINRKTENYIELVPKINKIESELDSLISTSQKTIAQKLNPTIIPGHYVGTNGAIGDSESYSYFIIENLKQGETIYVRAYYGAQMYIVMPTLWGVCAYDQNDSPVASKGVTSVSDGKYIVPADIVKVAITFLNTQYTIESVVVLTESDIESVEINDAVSSAVFGDYPQEVRNDIAESSRIQNKANSVKKNFDILFNGAISSFNKLSIGRGTNDLNSAKIEIDNTNVTLYNGVSSGVSVAHELSIQTYIFVSLHVNNDRLATLTIMSASGRFTHAFENIAFVGCDPVIYAETDSNTALTNCALAFVCEDIDNPLWIFGDSYVSYTIERWPYWVHKMGYDGYLLNGLSGEASGHAIQDLRNLLQFGTPKYIVWALGMNDADESDVVNPVWKSCFDELCGICNQYDITLILSTIPNVPTRSNVYKNAIVIDSGYKYIDFASSVGALTGSTWFNGMLSDDGIHPSQTGAYALASSVLKDFPYIAIK